MLVSAVPVNALAAIVKEWDEQLNVIDDRAKLPANAHSPIDSTDMGMSMEDKYASSNAKSAITFNFDPSSNVTDVKAILLNESESILVVAAGTVRWPSCTLVASRANSIFRQLVAGIAKALVAYGVPENASALINNG
jgi:hypothetical protein